MSHPFSHIEFASKISKTVKIADPASRRKKADKILSVLQTHAKEHKIDLSDQDCLDIGCSTCMITTHLVSHFKRVVGFDPDIKALQLANQYLEDDSPLKRLVGNGLCSPFPNESFDVIICNQIYEHVPDAQRLFDEIYRLLRNNGICYLSAGNRLMVMEPHYKLPFLSWLPPTLANAYLKITHNIDQYQEKHYSLWGLKALLHKFNITDYTLRVLKDPDRFHLDDMIGKSSWIPKIPFPALKILRPIIPNFIFVLSKQISRTR